MGVSLSGPASLRAGGPFSILMAHISSIVFNKDERPLRATIRTRLGTVKVEWRDVRGYLCWFTSGNLDAKKLVFPAIQRIERMVAGGGVSLLGKSKPAVILNGGPGGFATGTQ